MLASVLKRIFGKGQAAPHEHGAWLDHATALQRSGRHGEAAAICQARLTEKPDDVDALQALAAAFFGQGRTGDGLACLKKASELAPAVAGLHVNLGRVSAATGNIEAAIASFRQALAVRPDLPEAAAPLIALLKATERYDEAEDVCRAALAAAGDSSRHRHALAAVLFEQGRVEEAIAELKASLALAPHAPVVHSDLLRALNYVDGAESQRVFKAHCEWGERHARPLTERAAPHRNQPDPQRRLRVGYVSPYFRKHAVTFFLESVIEHHDRMSFDVLLYADVPRPDEYSERLKAYGSLWRSTVGSSDEGLAQMVRDDSVDILVDLSGHTPSHRLLAFARRPAPVQVTWNGYPNTTGMTAMDYRITDEYCDPPGETERLHTEQLVRLPGIYMSWRPPSDAPDPGPLSAVSSGRITFGSFNSCFKITPTTIGLWSRILNEVPGSRLLLFTVVGARAERRIREHFAVFGIGNDQLKIRPRLTHEAFLEAHRHVDIALDSFPYHGTTTTCFSLWMGVPVVSLTGNSHASRVGLTLLTSIGLADLAASTQDAYVAAAVRLAHNLDALADMRSGLRRRMLSSPLTDGAAYAGALEDAYREIWRTWCSKVKAGQTKTAGP